MLIAENYLFDSSFLTRATGGHRNIHQKKRKFELGRPAANTKIGHKRVHTVRGRGGNLKFRAMRLDAGNFVWPGEHTTHKTRILDTVYNASNQELVRTKTLTKNTIVQIDATPFRQWYLKHYAVDLSKKKEGTNTPPTEVAEPVKQSAHVKAKIAARQAKRVLEEALVDQFQSGRLLACISSRPGQSGRADGYILEGDELHFYMKKLEKKKKQ
jgi:small subunit ribosomal protein S8e